MNKNKIIYLAASFFMVSLNVEAAGVIAGSEVSELVRCGYTLDVAQGLAMNQQAMTKALKDCREQRHAEKKTGLLTQCGRTPAEIDTLMRDPAVLGEALTDCRKRLQRAKDRAELIRCGYSEEDADSFSMAPATSFRLILACHRKERAGAARTR